MSIERHIITTTLVIDTEYFHDPKQVFILFLLFLVFYLSQSLLATNLVPVPRVFVS